MSSSTDSAVLSRRRAARVGPTTRIAVIAGTRPEIIKLAPVIGAVESHFGTASAMVIDTGQHYDHAMSGQFWADLGIAQPEVRLAAGGHTRAGCVGYLTAALGQVLATARPAAVIVQGDTNTTLAGALAANAEGIPLVHVEAGLRSWDRAMPEEHNRIVVDHLADLCCAATPANAANLSNENISPARIAVTGNTIVESVGGQLADRRERLDTVRAFGLEVDRFILATIHRPENTDDPSVLRSILHGLDQLSGQIPVVLALHPRTRRAVEAIDASDLLQHLIVTEPLGARDFLSLVAHAALIVSDSGGIAEEVTVLKRPLVVVRRSTERPESIETGFARLVSPADIATTSAAVLVDRSSRLDRLRSTPSPFGDGLASKRIVTRMATLISEQEPAGV